MDFSQIIYDKTNGDGNFAFTWTMHREMSRDDIIERAIANLRKADAEYGAPRGTGHTGRRASED